MTHAISQPRRQDAAFLRRRYRARPRIRFVGALHGGIGLLAFAACLAACLLCAADPGDEVVVIYNTRVPESKVVADYYAQRRHVPTNQIFGFALSTGDEISRSEFRDALQKPLAKELESKKLWHIRAEILRDTNNQPGAVEWRVQQSKIRYAVLTYGVPYRIRNDPAVKEPIEETMRPELRRNDAAVDNELALLPCIEQKLPLAGPLRNPHYGATNRADLHPTNGVLLVARLDGPSAAIAKGLVDKALEAEANGMWGRAYFDLRGITDPAYKLGDTWIANAAEICRQLGFETTVDTNFATFPPEFPMSQIAIYCGWYEDSGNVSGPLARPNVEFMPGAFAYHLHSYSAAALRSTNTNWVGPLLNKGATISMGCVAEPFLTGTPDLGVFVSRLIFQGFTFGEAAYASQPALSWQVVAVGDPLYRPFGKLPQLLHEQLAVAHSPLLEWSFLRLVNLNIARGVPLTEMARFLESTELTKQSSVLTEKLGAIYQALGKPASAVDALERALKLDCTPLQRVRIRLTLADRLNATDRGTDALAQLEGVVQENPDYPNPGALYQRIVALAQKLGKKDVVENYTARMQKLAGPGK